MLIRTPDYYDKFKCIAGECKDTCCAGWQVDVDDASYEYYKTITGDFGDRLHSVMVSKEQKGSFALGKTEDALFSMTIICAICTPPSERMLYV